MTPPETTPKSSKGGENIIELIIAVADCVAALLKNYSKLAKAWNKLKSRPPP